MAQISVPIQVNLPDNWIDLVIERMKQDGTVMPVVHGRWEYDGTCSACRKRWDEDMWAHGQDWGYFDPMPPYCNNCGAKMDLEDTE